MNNVATISQPPSIMAAMADRYGMRPDAFEATLRATVIPSTASREELAAFLLVAKEYHLNPITREIYAFPKKGGGIQPIVGVDGWTNLCNSHPAFDGMEFIDTVEKGVVTAITCRIFRKDRSHAIEATEYLQECFRQTEPWQRWPRRMLRHKAFVQAARYAFGFAGIYDADEAERFAETTERHSKRTSDLEQRLTRLTQHPPQPTPQPPPSPIPPQPEDGDEDWPPPPADEDMVELETPPTDPMHEDGASPAAEGHERQKLFEAGRGAAREASRGPSGQPRQRKPL
jgi:phage recombination protein Bet